jgi:hypothetical protein
VIEVERRIVHLLGVTASPDAAWVVQVARNFASELEDAGRRFQFLIRDRDAKFTSSFDILLASAGIEAVQTPVASPRANAFAERFVRTVREDCLDHLLVFSRRHLEVVLAEYVRHYNGARPHRGLGLEQPLAPPLQSSTDEASSAATSSAASSTSTSGPPDPGREHSSADPPAIVRALTAVATDRTDPAPVGPTISRVTRKVPPAARPGRPGQIFGPFRVEEGSRGAESPLAPLPEDRLGARPGERLLFREGLRVGMSTRIGPTVPRGGF